MKTLIFIIAVLFVTNSISAQNKNITVYYGDSTRTINLSDSDSLKLFICGVSKVSYAGKSYNTVSIGNQCWLKENLDIGTRIQGSQNSTNNGVIEKYCYNNDPNNCITYGALYTWDEAMSYVSTQGTQGICPLGWRIPTLTQVQTLSTSVNDNSNALKNIGQGSGGGSGTNTSGFSAFLTGYRNFDGNFTSLAEVTHFWSSTAADGTSAYSTHLGFNNNGIFFINYSKQDGFGVRCVMN
jgi:uncharacterized protein (TIGR02145 family)